MACSMRKLEKKKLNKLIREKFKVSYEDIARRVELLQTRCIATCTPPQAPWNNQECIGN